MRVLVPAVTCVVVTASLLTGTPTATAAPPEPPQTQAFAATDHCLGQCHDIVPPGANGSATLADILAHKAFGTYPGHAADQLAKYDSLALGYPTLTTDRISAFFNDSSFGVEPSQVESTVKPRADVTIVRDKATGAPHITGTTRSGTMYGAGYAAAQDRLFLMDVLRRVGRGQLTPFAGGGAANQDLEQRFFADSPYTEAELQRQIDRAAQLGPRGAQAMADARDYIEGINKYITEAYNGRYFPGEYVLLGHIDAISNKGTIEPFKLTDLAVIASVVGSQFGSGGGGEVQNAIAKLAIQERYGVVEGERMWQSLRTADDPEHIQTVHNGQRFPYGLPPANPAGAAVPDRGSVRGQQLVFDRTGATPAAVQPKHTSTPTGKPATVDSLQGIMADGVLPDLLKDKRGMSNALLVSGAHTASGNPVAVFGPQTGYFAPQLLMIQELQGPGISARGASFAGISFYVLLGRGQDYAWSATTSSQDIIDTYAVELCSPSGAPTVDSNHYRWRDQCLPMDVLERRNSWYWSIGSPVDAGAYTLRSYRTKYGIVTHRATVNGTPVAYTRLRSTYMHELDAIIGFQEFNDPSAITSAADFQRAASHIGYTFNWFYADSADIAYFNSGDNPVRHASVDPSMPVRANAGYDWAGWNPDTNIAQYTPAVQHPQVVNQDYLISWNNNQAPGTAGNGPDRGAVHRGDLLDARVKRMVTGNVPVTRTNLVQAMAEAGLTDLRAERVLPLLLRVIGTAPTGDAAVDTAVSQLRAWLAAGGQRKQTGPGARAYLHPDAIRVMDAWWPGLVQSIFEPGMGSAAYTEMTRVMKTDETPSKGNAHQGSAYQTGWWGYVHKDLRAVLNDPVAGPLGAEFCGAGNLAQCRTVLINSLRTAAQTPATTVYPGDGDCAAGDQWCADAIIHNALGGITHGVITTQYRPTFQQVVEFPSSRRAPAANLASGATATATSYESGLLGSYPPGLAVDGNPATRWASSNSDAQSLTVDLGAARPVSRVRLSWEAAHATAYRIETSANGSTWTTAWSTTAGDGGTDLIVFPQVNARYVRMQGVTRATTHGYSLYEVGIYSR